MLQSELKGNVLEIKIDGRIDSSNAADISAELDEIGKANPHESLVIDAEKLSYISSAGLRLLTKLQKSEKQKISIKNASTEIFEIFKMTGFNSIVNVTLAP